MKLGDLVQSNIFDPNGSGGFGLILSKGEVDEHWNVQWAGYKDELTEVEGVAYEVHEEDIVVYRGQNETR